MRIGIDLDDVISDLLSELIDFYNKKYDDVAVREDIFTWDFFPKEIHENFASSGGYKNLKLIPEAKELLAFLNSIGEVSIITIRNEEYREETVKWLEENLHGLYKKENLYLTSGNKIEVCKKIGIQLLIDDSLRFTKQVADKGIYAILFDNRTPMFRNAEEHPKVYKAKSIEEVKKYVLMIKDIFD